MSEEPVKKNVGGRPPKYPWRTMEVGESFMVYGRTTTSLCNDARELYRPRRFRTMKVVQRGVVGVRVWRIE